MHGALAGSSPHQLSLDLAAPAAPLRRDAFIDGDARPGALALLDAFLASTAPLLCVCGPEGSGKTHLLTIALHGAAPLALRSQTELISAPPIFGVDDAHRVDAPALLFECVEYAREHGRRVILAGRGAPSDWARDLRDLATRLNAAPRIVLEEPNEDQWRAVFGRQCLARQWRVPAPVMAFVAPRLPRTYRAISAFLAAFDAAIRAEPRAATVSLAREVLSTLYGEPATAYTDDLETIDRRKESA